MKYFKKIALSTAAIVGVASTPVIAADFTSHHNVDEKAYEAYAEKLPAEDKLELREYLNYEQREPCQFYQPIPKGFVRDGCHLRHENEKSTMKKAEYEKKPQPMKKLNVNNILTDYEINFEFDSAAIEYQAKNTLDRVADEIQRYNPREVTVAGYTDKAGPSDYNIKLSERRAAAVSEALNDRGVTNRILDKEAYGESRPAIDTNDGVALRENRRVVIEFRK